MTTLATLLKPLALGLLTIALLGGCASTNNPRDPLEPFNRAVYTVNDGLDKIVMKPVATVYRAVLPQFVRTGVTNFFNNLYDILTALNNLLQGKLADSASDLGRIVVNSTVGVLGLVDVGTEIGLEKHREDFGQTLGRWGVTSGPYLQIPLLGPSSFRDGMGLLVDVRADPVGRIWRDHIATRNSLWGLYFINLRANLLDSTKILDEAALDPYEFQRDAYLQRRRNLVHDGNPPPEGDDIPDLKTKPRTELDDAGTAPRSEVVVPRMVASVAPATRTTASRTAVGNSSPAISPEPARPFAVRTDF
jgi:phospholipid-binding lipoprotein MlaA